ncbi:MAG: DNA/RNA nuclease SfsA [Proteobacteria bacterium]|nr:DNA/RNA nuclease SfsA [Pseudomonadota bacterium]NBX85683.1 DNA/RNA nuclease SfsA [Pseudomonadota bacterium]
MHFTTPLTRWPFKNRQKRFFIHGQEEGQIAHCANTGSLRGVLENTTHVWVSKSDNPDRKLQFSAELCELTNGTLVNINTAHANTLAAEAIKGGHLPHLKNLPLQAEAKFSAETRFDFKAGDPNTTENWIEVKNTTLAEGTENNKVAMFPDAVTTRGLKHLQTLTHIVQQGGHATQIYIISRADCTRFTPAEKIDPAYATALQKAQKAGVHIFAFSCQVTPQAITIDKTLPLML